MTGPTTTTSSSVPRGQIGGYSGNPPNKSSYHSHQQLGKGSKPNNNNLQEKKNDPDQSVVNINASNHSEKKMYEVSPMDGK